MLTPSMAIPNGPVSVSLQQPVLHQPQETQCSGAHGLFAGEVNSALDARLGIRSELGPFMMPMANAPLFGPVRRRVRPNINNQHTDYVLPQRKHADYLMDIYWRYIQPSEPLLDRESFSLLYEALFAGTTMDTDERVFLATINTIFALATQAQEELSSEKRDEASNTFFNRAWDLLPPENIIWEAGSLEIVQCLLLMARYLQCTSNPNQCWMAISSAVCVAQNLGLHNIDRTCSGGLPLPPRVKHRRKRVWQCCVFIHRYAENGTNHVVLITDSEEGPSRGH